MGRKVYITSDMSVDERVIAVSEKDPQAALMWPWLLTAFDDWGRTIANSKRLKAQVFPGIPSISYEDVEKALALYNAAGLLQLYEVDGKRYMAHVDHFRLFCHPARPSRIPDPPITGPFAKEICAYLEACRTWPTRGETPWLKYRRHILKRDGYRCVYCGSTDRLTVDHVIPRSKGGADTPDNLVTACFTCNRKSPLGHRKKQG